MQATEIKKGIYWVGAIDWDIRNFHGYLTERGTTYNAYLIIDEKITLVDTVKSAFTDEFLERISSIIDPSKIDVIISNHVEMDHSGSLPKIMELAPNATIVTNAAGAKGLDAHYRKGWNYHTVKSGDTYSIGERSFEFLLTPMVHWPDNMLTYMPEEKILFSNDSFGQHIATSERIDTEFPFDIILEQAKKYYANIVLPYSNQVKKELEAAKALDIKMIAPSHGLIVTDNIPKLISSYDDWADGKTEKKALIIFDTMWGSTEKIARAIQRGFENRGYKAPIFNLKTNHNSDIMTSVITADYICIGTSTLNRNMLPTVASFLHYLKGLAPKGKKAFSFGSFGWGSVALKETNAVLESCKFNILDTFQKKYIPTDEELSEIVARVEELID